MRLLSTFVCDWWLCPNLWWYTIVGRNHPRCACRSLANSIKLSGLQTRPGGPIIRHWASWRLWYQTLLPHAIFSNWLQAILVKLILGVWSRCLKQVCKPQRCASLKLRQSWWLTGLWCRATSLTKNWDSLQQTEGTIGLHSTRNMGLCVSYMCSVMGCSKHPEIQLYWG